MITRTVLVAMVAGLGITTAAFGQSFVIDRVTVSPAIVNSGEIVNVTVRVRNPGPTNGQLNWVRAIAAPVPPPLTATSTQSTFAPRLLGANQLVDVTLAVRMPTLLNCVSTLSFGFDVTVNGGTGTFTRSFTGVGNNVTVSPFCPDLTVPVPSGWTRGVVIANSPFAFTTPGIISALQPIYVSADIRNLGGPTSGGVPYTLQVVQSSSRTPVYAVSGILPPLAAVTTTSALRGTLIPAGRLIPCDNYEARLLVDPSNIVLETSDGNNSDASLVTFIDTPQSIQAQPVDQTVCSGASASFNVVVSSGGAHVDYRWKKDGIAIPITGPGSNPTAATSTLQLTAVSAADAGLYSCAASNPCNSLMTTTARLTVLPSVSITQQPTTSAVCIGDNATFTIVTTGNPSGLQWRRNGAPINPATNPTAVTATLVIPGVQPSDAGTFDCVASGCGSVTSRAVQLFVDPADLGSEGGLVARDGLLDNNDFIVFVDFFFANDPRIDFGSEGGALGSDGLLDSNDFITFINLFFTPCGV